MSGCMTLAQPPDRVSDRRPGPSSIHSPSPVLSASACTSDEDGGLRRSELLGLDWDDVDLDRTGSFPCRLDSGLSRRSYPVRRAGKRATLPQRRRPQGKRVHVLDALAALAAA